MPNLRVSLCGPIADAQAPLAGGYEVANARTIGELRSRGISVTAVPYPSAGSGRAVSPFRYLLGFLRIAWQIHKLRRRVDIFHHTLLYQKFVYVELFLQSVARAHHIPTVVDIRAGSMLTHYELRSGLYRWTFDRILRQADLVMIEGETYRDFVAARTYRTPVYFPNFVTYAATLDDINKKCPVDQLRLLYLGRITSEKGIETVLEVFRLLHERGVPVHLQVIGTGDGVYVDSLRKLHDHPDITWTPGLHYSKVREAIADAHFFVFPTRHSGEGHSNSLSEAMALGVVPVCTDNGFNLHVVGDSGRVLPADRPAASFADAIENIWRSDGWLDLATTCMTRARNEFHADSVMPTVIAAYAQLMDA